MAPHRIAVVGQGELVRDLVSYALGPQHELVPFSDPSELAAVLGQGRRYAAIVVDSSVLAGSAAPSTIDVLRAHGPRLIVVTDDVASPIDISTPLPEARVVKTSEVARLQIVVDEVIRG